MIRYRTIRSIIISRLFLKMRICVGRVSINVHMLVRYPKLNVNTFCRILQKLDTGKEISFTVKGKTPLMVR